MDKTKVLIAGTGPAGLTAALYCARADLEPVILEGSKPGGQLIDTTDVENYPGFPDPKTGPELIAEMHKQAERFGAQFVHETALEADLSERPFKIKTDNHVLTAETLIVASGATARWLGLESETALKGHGVSACATCDGFFFRNKKVIVVGGGDSAMEEANFLTKFASQVTVVHRRGELRASVIMQKRAMDNEKIDFIWNSVVDDIHDVEKGTVTGVTLKNVETEEKTYVPCDGVFLAIGHIPNTEFLGEEIKYDEAGFIVVDEPSTKTTVPGVFAAGDVMDPNYKQAVTAAGTGCRAAIDAERFLAENPEPPRPGTKSGEKR
ncbi:MAG: thioredoxin-disulfide reductase [Candidatus Sumerlaeota bacterium]